MAKLGISTGIVPDDGNGDSLLDGAVKINSNFDEIYAYFGDGTNLTFAGGGVSSQWVTTGVGIHTLSSVGIGTTNPTSKLTVTGDGKFTGVVTATSFVGNLTGTASTSTLATNAQGLTGTPNLNVGVVTATRLNVGSSGTIISSTIAGLVGIGTTNPRFKLEVGAVGASGTSLYVNGDARVTGILTVGSASITLNGTTNTINVGSGVTIDGSTGVIEASSIVIEGTTLTGAAVTSITAGSGISVDQSTGNVTITATGGGGTIVTISDTEPESPAEGNLWYDSTISRGFIYYVDEDSSQWVDFSPSGGGSVGGGGESYWVETSAGIHTLSNVGIGTTNPTSALTVNGNVSIAGSIGIGTESGIYQFELLDEDHKIIMGTVDGENPFGLGAFISLQNATNQLDFSGLVHLRDDGGAMLTNNRWDGFSEQGTYRFGPVANLVWDIYPTYIGQTFDAFYVGSNNVFLANVDERFYISSSEGIVFGGYGNVGIGTTNPTSKFTVKGNTSLETLSISGVSTLSGNVSFGSSAFFGDSQKIILGNDSDLEIFHNGSSRAYFRNYTDILAIQSPNEIEFRTPTGFYARFTESFGALLYANDNEIKLQTLGAGVTVTGTTFTNQLSVSGVSTLTSNVSVGGTISIDGGVKLVTNNETIVGTSGTVGEIKRIGGAPFFYDGSAWREFVLSSGTPVTQPADTDWDSVVFRATFDDDFTDAKFGATPVLVGSGSSIVGSPVRIGTGAYRNNGSVGAGVSYAYRPEYDFTGSWTIEFWMYVDSSPVNTTPNSPKSLISMHSTSGIGTGGNWALAMREDSAGNKGIMWYNQNNPSYRGGIPLFDTSTSPWDSLILKKWNHFALVRESSNGSLHFYINGTEKVETTSNTIIDNDILNINGAGLHITGNFFTIGGLTFNTGGAADVIIDDVRISAGFGTAGQRYTSIGISTQTTFTPPTTELPITGTLSSIVQPPGDKYGEIGLGTSPTWRGTSGVTVSQQSSGNYRVSFASSYTNANDYFVLSQGMDQGFASYVGVARSTTHVDFSINKQSDDTVVDTGSLAVQIKNHI